MAQPVAPTGKVAVLVVEDELLIRLAIAEALRGEGFEVMEASTADQAIQHLTDGNPIAIVVTDVDLPGAINGFGIAWKAHAQGVGVIVVSGRVMPTPELLPPTARFFSKPVAFPQLVSALRDLCCAGRSPH